jgi:beta-lactamase regulating signal transducer with metallopeptidase domain
VAAAGTARVQEAHLLPGPSPAAFCVPGRRPLVVITSPTLAVLATREIHAVLDHEREHLRRRHALQITWAEAVTGTLGRAGVLRKYATEERRLAELAADDAASARHGRRVVATALLAMSTHPGDAAAAGGLALADTHTVERIRRLLTTSAASRRRDALVMACASILTMVPLFGVLLPAAAMYW